MVKRLLGISLACLMLLAMALPSVTSAESVRPKEVVYGQIDVKARLDRTVETYLQTGQITDLLFEGMLSNNLYTNELEPCLATGRAVISEDALTYSFEIKQGTKFHDGTELTAKDVKFSLERILTPATGSLVTEDYTSIVGANDMLDGTATELAGFKMEDDYHFSVTIEQPWALFEFIIGTTSIYPEKACTEAGDDWGVNTVIGTGPFKLESHQRDVGLRVVRFDGYHDAAKLPKIDSVYFKWYQDSNTMLLDYEAGNLDSMILDTPFVDQYRGTEFEDQIGSFDSFGHFFVVLNFNMDPWKDNPKAREAFSYAIDVDAICNDLFDGIFTTASCLINPANMGYDPEVPVKAYDPEKAKELLAEAGYPDGVDVEMVTTNLEGTGGKMILVMQQQAAAAGFRITPRQVDAGVWTDIRNNGQVPTFIGNWYLGLPDSDGIIYGFFHSSNNIFFSSMYKSEEYDALAEKARITLDDAERAEIYRQADKKLVSEDFVTIPIGWPMTFYLYAPWLIDFDTRNFVPSFQTMDIDLASQPVR